MRVEASGTAPITVRTPARDRAVGKIAAARLIPGAFAAVLLLVAARLPLWQARLLAPQYPDGLRMTAYGTRVEGDIDEINSLNHYIGMKPLQLGDVWETALWIPTIVAALVSIAVLVAVEKGWLARLARVVLWSIPFGVLGAIQFRLYEYGHDLDPAAALRVPEFTPWVVGPTRVWNFVTWAFPGPGLVALIAAAAVMSFGPRLIRRLRGRARPASAGVITLLLLLFSALPALASPHHSHDNPGPETGGPVLQPDERLGPRPVQHQGVHDPGATARGRELISRLRDAKAGEHIILAPGVYHGRFTIGVPLVLEGRGAAVIHGDGTGTVLEITADDVTVRGVTVAASGPGPVGSPAGIEITGDRAVIAGVRVEDSYTGISVKGSRGVRIVQTAVIGRPHAAIADEGHAVGEHSARHSASSYARGDGISLIDVEAALIRAVEISGSRDGIYLSTATDVMIDRARVTDSRYGIHGMYARHATISESLFESNLSGAVLMYGGPALVLGNTIERQSSPSTGFGIIAKDVVGVQVAKNVIVNNRVGIHVEGGEQPDKNRFLLNTVALNQVGVSLYPTAAATFSGNSFVENVVQVSPQGGAIDANTRWSEQGAGNFWSGYRGFDRIGNGVGDLAHREGTAIAELMSRAPELQALASSPAFRLLDAIRSRWIGTQGAVTDDAPLMRPHSPALPHNVGPLGAPLALAVISAALLLAAIAGLHVLRPRTSGRRWLRVAF